MYITCLQPAVHYASSVLFFRSLSRFCISASVYHVLKHYTIVPQQPNHFRRRLVVYSLTLCSLPQSFLLLFVPLSGDIELNPGPSAFTLCTLNMRSILQPLHSAALSDLIDNHNTDLFYLTETWIKPTTTAAELLNCTPPHNSLISTPRNGSNKISSSGGGTAFFIREPFTQLSTSVPDFSSFESYSVTLQLSHTKISVINIYRSPSSSTHTKAFFVFLDDFSYFLSFAATAAHEFIITGDFNIHLDNPADTLTSQFLSLLSSFNLSQHAQFPAHGKNHILDLVITSSDTSLVPAVSFTHWSPSDQFPVFTKLSINLAPLPPPTLYSFRLLHSIDVSSFLTNLKSSQLITDPPKLLGPLLSANNNTLSSLLDKHAPIVTTLSRRQSPSTMVFYHPPCISIHPPPC